MVIGLYLSIVLLGLVCVVLVSNIKEIKTDPIVYGVEKKDFVICSCYDQQGNSYDYNSTGIIPTKTYGFNYNFAEK